MAELPTKRKSAEELAEMRSEAPTRPTHPAAATAQMPQKKDLPLSVGDWLITLLVLAFPVVNLVLYIYWAFISKGNQCRVNFCKASLILMPVGIVLAILFDILL